MHIPKTTAMSNPLKMPNSTVDKCPISAFFPLDKHKKLIQRQKLLKDVEYEKNQLSSVRVKPVASVIIPRQYVKDLGMLDRYKDKLILASAPYAPITMRKRSAVGYQMVRTICANVPDSLRLRIESHTKHVYMVSSGASGSIDRFRNAAPKWTDAPIVTPTLFEIQRAKIWTGLVDMRERGLEPLSAYDDGSERESISIVKGADAGSPSFGKLNNTEVLEIHQQILYDVDQRLLMCESYEEARDILLKLREERPEWFVCTGKAKTDVYKESKLDTLSMRLYMLLPAWARFGMQRGAQPLEHACESILTNDDAREWHCSRTAKKVSLAYGGAMQLVLMLDEHLQRYRWSATTLGDDTWLNLLCGQYIVTVSIDCSNFDLTQRFEMFKDLTIMLADELWYVDPVASYLFRFFTLEPRWVALFSHGVWEVTDTGTSGFPLQSVRNDLIMSINIQRIVRSWQDWRGDLMWLEGSREGALKAKVEAEIQKAGKSLGLSARIDEICIMPNRLHIRGNKGELQLNGLKAMLVVNPFLFIGYRFTFDAQGRVRVFQDYPRVCGNLLYPNKAWYERELFDNEEAVRMVGTLINLGIPPENSVLRSSGPSDVSRYMVKMVTNGLIPARDVNLQERSLFALYTVSGVEMTRVHDAMVHFARTYVDKVLRDKPDDQVLDDLDVEIVSPFVGVNFERTLIGMRSALDKLKELWVPFNGSDESFWHVTIATWPDLVAPLRYPLALSRQIEDKLAYSETVLFNIEETYVDEIGVLSIKRYAQQPGARRPMSMTCRAARVSGEVRGWVAPKGHKVFGKLPPQIMRQRSVPTLQAFAASALLSKPKHGYARDVYEQALSEYDSDEELESYLSVRLLREDSETRSRWSEESVSQFTEDSVSEVSHEHGVEPSQFDVDYQFNPNL